MPVPSHLPTLRARAQLWSADELAAAPGVTHPTGFAALDAELPGGGWPVGALVELLQAAPVCQAWRLLLPWLGRQALKPVALIAPPHLPGVPALAAQGLGPERLLWVQAHTPAEQVWACEQALGCADLMAVLAWLPQVRSDQLRRLHWRAQQQTRSLFVMRPGRVAPQASPAVLRLALAPAEGDPAQGLRVQVLKRRGPPCLAPLHLPARPPHLAAVLQASRQAALARQALVTPSPTVSTDHALDRLAALL